MKETISKFAPGTMILLLGIGLLGFAITNDQDTIFITASISIALAGIITLLNASHFITNTSAIGIAVGLLFIVGYLTYENYVSIDTPIQFMKEKQIKYAAVIQSLKDLRQAELTYKKKNQKFIGNMDTLMHFLSNDSVAMVIKDGEIPDSLAGNELRAIELGIIIRDTVMYLAKDIAFNSDYLLTRDSHYPIDLETLRYVPHSENVDFLVDAGEIVRSSGAKVQVFEITDAAPFDPKDVMKVGSMIDPTTSGNWKEEK